MHHMKSQDHRQKQGQDTGPVPSDSQPPLHLLNDPGLDREFSQLGFDLKSIDLTHIGSAGPFDVLTHHYPLGKEEEPVYLLECRFLIGRADRLGDVMDPDEEENPDLRIIAIQAACINALNVTDNAPRFVFEKTYAIGNGSLPNRTSIMADILQGQQSNMRQLGNILKFFLALKRAEF